MTSTICRWCNSLFEYKPTNMVPTICDKCRKDCTCGKDRMSEMSCRVHGVSAQLDRTQME